MKHGRTVIYEHCSPSEHAKMSMCMFVSEFAWPNYLTNQINAPVWVTYTESTELKMKLLYYA